MSRGFACIALDRPKDTQNVGSILRIAGNYGAALVVLGSPRCGWRHAADTGKSFKTLPLLSVASVFDALPEGAVPVAVDLLPDATPLPDFKHPEQAFYVFGAEDSTLREDITSRCAATIYVPTQHCMNLAVTTAVVLYDRMAKGTR